LASMQVTGLRSNQSAYFRSQASIMSYDMADRMRLNAERALAGDYDNFDTGGNVPQAPDCIDETAGCTAAQLVLVDKAEWTDNLLNSGDGTALLPNVRGVISRGLNNRFTITI